MGDRPWRVFVSHTSELRAHPAGRSYIAEVERAVAAAGHAVVDMADFPSADQEPAELCAGRVRSSDVYLGVFGTRYGSPVRDRPGVSYTEWEFDTATAAGLPRLVFLLDTEVPAEGLPPAALIDHRYGGRQEAFRERVRAGSGLTAQTFSSPAQLGRLVERSLRDLAGHDSPAADNLPLASAVFEGRDVAHLAGVLDATPSGRAAVFGLGGIGKTELALHYARAYRDRHHVVWWITADTPENVSLGLAALAGRLQPAGTLADAEAWAINWLQNHRAWLLILDNVEDTAHIEPLLGQVTGRGRVLITTRRDLGAARWARLAVTPVHLDVLTRDASVRVLTRLAGLADEEGAGRLAAALDGLPLALQQAAAYLGLHGLTFDGYRTLLAGNFDRVADDDGAGLSPERTLARVWRMSIDAVEGRAPFAGRVLRVMAWLGPEGLPEDVLRPLAETDLDLSEALAALASYSLVSRAGGIVGVHRLVQAAARRDDRAAAAGILRAALPDDPAKNVAGWARWNALLPHVDALLEHAGADHDDPVLLHIAYQAAKYRHYQGHLPAAIAGFEQALAGRERVLGPDHPDTLRTSHNLAYAYQTAGRVAEAVARHERNIADRRRVLGPDHPETLLSRHNLAFATRESGRPADAITMYESVLDDRARVLGTDHPQTLTTRNNLAFAYRDVGRLPDATALFEQVCAERRRVLGPSHPDTLMAHSNLASAYREAGRFGEAIALLEQVADDRAKVFGDLHQRTLSARNALAFAYREAGRAADAVPLHERAVAEARQVLGDNHLDTLRFRQYLAYAYEEVGRLAEALVIHEQVLAGRRRILGEDHPLTLVSRHSLAVAQAKAGRTAEAIAGYESVLADRRTVHGPDHPRTLLTGHCLALAYREAGRTAQARALLEAVLADRLRILGPDHPDTRTTEAALRA